MISRRKMSKRMRKELDNKKRVTWGFRPVSRVKQNGKLYSRKRKNYEQEYVYKQDY